MEHMAPTSKKKNYIITGVASFLVIGILIFVVLNTTKKHTSNPTQTNNAQQATNTAQPNTTNQRVMYDPQTGIRYEIQKTWKTDNGGYGKSIVIDKEYITESGMAALGGRLRSDNADEEKVYIFLYTDAAAVELKDKPISKMSEAESTLYFDNYVGTYTKSTNIGFEEFTLYFDGFYGSNTKTIKY